MTTTDPRIAAAAQALLDVTMSDLPERATEEYAGVTWHGFEKDAVAMLAAADAVDPLRQAGHRVEIQQFSWTLQHPAECRPDLLDCHMTRTLQRLGVSGIDDGTYDVELTADGSLFFPDEVPL